jgi:hypothetical protein
MAAASKGAPECPVFYPTIHEVNSMSFVEYVERLEKQKGFREAGVCKIVAPDGWAPRRTGYNRLNFELPRWEHVQSWCGRATRCVGWHKWAASLAAKARQACHCCCFADPCCAVPRRPLSGPSGSTPRGGRACIAR